MESATAMMCVKSDTAPAFLDVQHTCAGLSALLVHTPVNRCEFHLHPAAASETCKIHEALPADLALD
jgi:hypothetical protein